MAFDAGFAGTGSRRYLIRIAGNGNAYFGEPVTYVYVKDGGNYYYCNSHTDCISVYAAVFCEGGVVGVGKRVI